GNCAEGLTCDATSCTCKKLPGVGEACADGTAENCAEGKCNSFSKCDKPSCLCIAKPAISWISPDNGAGGNLITIGGVNFGNEKGNVIFVNKTDTKEIAARLAGDVNKECAYSDWTDNKIMAEIPSGIALGDYDIKVVSVKTGLSDKKEFKVNNITRPGLCAAYKIEGAVRKEEGKFQDQITLAGVNLGNINKVNEIIFGNESNGINPINSQFTNNGLSIQGVGIPNLLPNLTTIFVKDESKGNPSNPVNFTIIESPLTPKISYFSPAAGHSGDYITIYGKGFGPSRREVKFGTATGDFSFPQECLLSVWKDDKIIVKVPKGISSGEYILKVKIDDTQELESADKFYAGDYCSKDKENPVSCSIINQTDSCVAVNKGICITSVVPGLCKINPVKGPAKTPVTFYGENFGVLELNSKKGSVLFNDKDGVKNVAPSEWKNGASGAADKVTANVPDLPRSGEVKILSAKGMESNGISFEAGSCMSASGEADNNKCPESKICCGVNTYFEGSCVTSASECGSSPKSPADYIWTFTTKPPEIIPKCGDVKSQKDCENNGYCCWAGELCANICPLGKLLQVKEQCYRGINCVSGSVGPSPSPWNKWPNGENACVDSIIRAEFSVPVLQTVLTALNIEIKKCDSEGCVSVQDVIGSFNYETIAGSNPASCTGFSFIPAELENSSWYEVLLKGNGIKSIDGKFLDGDKNGEPGGDYIWKFKTRDNPAPCEIGCPLVIPDKYYAEKKSKIKYEGLFTAKDNKCVILSGKNKAWAWSSSDPAKAAISGVRDCCGDCDKNKTNWACVLPREETNGEKINITGEVKKGSQSEHSSGELTIDFEDFKVSEIWPSAGCDSACLNSAVAARFSNEIDFSTANKNNLKLYKCDDEKYLTCNEI
ncbi:MAG: IPT/TIG domain-containing protein, partial [bacterium]